MANGSVCVHSRGVLVSACIVVVSFLPRCLQVLVVFVVVQTHRRRIEIVTSNNNEKSKYIYRVVIYTRFMYTFMQPTAVRQSFGLSLAPTKANLGRCYFAGNREAHARHGITTSGRLPPSAHQPREKLLVAL
jgi:hypothetical protein